MSISAKDLDVISKQFALDCNLGETVLTRGDYIFAPSKRLSGSRVIAGTSDAFRVILFAGKAYIMCKKEMISGWAEIFGELPARLFMNFSNLRTIDYILKDQGLEIADTHIYYLPDADKSRDKALNALKNLNTRTYREAEINQIPDKGRFSNAIFNSPTQPDAYALVAFDDKDDIMAVAGASLDGKYTRQIGIDVVEKYRRLGLASTLVAGLKYQIIDDGFLPFYGCSVGHNISRMVAIKAGFLPAFAEIYVKEAYKFI